MARAPLSILRSLCLNNNCTFHIVSVSGTFGFPVLGSIIESVSISGTGGYLCMESMVSAPGILRGIFPSSEGSSSALLHAPAIIAMNAIDSSLVLIDDSFSCFRLPEGVS